MTVPEARALELARLHRELLACRKCHEAGHAIAIGPIVHGAITAKGMTIGQAPGPTEIIAKRPFNAGSGKRLFEWLGRAGFDEAEFRATQYMAAVTRCYPGKGKNGGGDRVPSPEEQALCRPFLDREIALIDPTLIIPIGKLAIGLFFDPRLQLAEVVGTEKRDGSRWIVPLPHPSGASTWHQKPENRTRVEKAIRLIRKRRIELGG